MRNSYVKGKLKLVDWLKSSNMVLHSKPHKTITACQMFCSSHIFVFWFFVFWSLYSCMIFFPFFSVLPLQNTNKDYIIFLYFHNFVAKSNQKQKNKKMGWTKQKMQRCRNPTTLNSLKSVLQNCRLLFFSLNCHVTKYQILKTKCQPKFLSLFHFKVVKGH